LLWQFDGERSAVPFACAFRCDRSAVSFDQLPNQCQPQSQSAATLPAGGIGLMIAFENMRQAFGRDALACIVYLDFDEWIGAPEFNVYPATRRGEFDGIR
jgi:hypothetical protein